MEDVLISPHERADQIGRETVEASLRTSMKGGVLSHGWIIAGPKGAGKATLAYRIARAILSPDSLSSPDSLDVTTEAQAFKLIAAGAHPDLFVAERAWNEKTSKFQSEITVETIRALTSFMNRTPAFGGYRVAIIDIADDLNRNAANALLKALEEPPENALLLLLSEAPGRLIATIRSRCRRIDLRSVGDEKIMNWLVETGAASREDAQKIAANAGGRPGYALRLAAGEGAEAIGLAEEFLRVASGKADMAKITRALTGKNTDEKWTIFRGVVTEKLAQAARALACNETPEIDLKSGNPAALVRAWEGLSTLAARGDALNLDRAQLISAMAHDLRAELTVA
ncbi:MAG: DNA polymerase III subunit delta' [Pseudomonadota bacterium]